MLTDCQEHKIGNDQRNIRSKKREHTHCEYRFGMPEKTSSHPPGGRAHAHFQSMGRLLSRRPGHRSQLRSQT